LPKFLLDMNELDEIRLSIDLIDSQLAVLFESRMKEVARIAEIKAENGLPFFNPEREKSIKEKNSKLVKDETVRPYFEKFYDSLVALSLQYQKKYYEK